VSERPSREEGRDLHSNILCADKPLHEHASVIDVIMVQSENEMLTFHHPYRKKLVKTCNLVVIQLRS
jgi:isochorismate synthase EntC